MPPLQSFKGFQMHHVMEWLGTIIEFNCFLLFLGLPTSGFSSCQVFSTICIGLMMEWLHTVVDVWPGENAISGLQIVDFSFTRHKLIGQVNNKLPLAPLTDWMGWGWDGIDFGYGDATALKIVQWPITFPSRAFCTSGQQDYSKEKSPPQPKPEQPYNITVFKFVNGIARANWIRRIGSLRF